MGRWLPIEKKRRMGGVCREKKNHLPTRERERCTDRVKGKGILVMMYCPLVPRQVGDAGLVPVKTDSP